MNKIIDRDTYLKSIKNRNLKIYLMGELVKEPLENPIIKPSIEAMAETYELAVREPELASVTSPFTGEKINRFLHIYPATGNVRYNVGQTPLTFGKFRGMTYSEVTREHPSYIRWALSIEQPKGKMASFVEYLWSNLLEE